MEVIYAYIFGLKLSRHYIRIRKAKQNPDLITRTILIKWSCLNIEIYFTSSGYRFLDFNWSRANPLDKSNFCSIHPDISVSGKVTGINIFGWQHLPICSLPAQFTSDWLTRHTQHHTKWTATDDRRPSVLLWGSELSNRAPLYHKAYPV